MDAVISIVPVLAGFVGGWLLRVLGLARVSDAEFLFRIIFYVCAPCLLLRALARAHIDGGLLVFCLAAAVCAVVGYAAGRLACRLLPLSASRAAVILVASMTVNSGFVLPFAEAVYGVDGLARLAAFELVNSGASYSFAYAIAAKANPDHVGRGWPVGKLLRSPPLLAIVAGFVIGVAGWDLPSVVWNTTEVFGAATAPIVTLGIGMVFNPGRANLGVATIAAVNRLAIGFAAAAGVIVAFGLEGVDRGMVLLMATAPVTTNAVAFASLEKLDVPFAAETLSLSLAIGLVVTSLVVLVVV